LVPEHGGVGVNLMPATSPLPMAAMMLAGIVLAMLHTVLGA
jgi:hypothetical protein